MVKISKFYQIWIRIEIFNLLIPYMGETRHYCPWNLECSKNRIFTITLEWIGILGQFLGSHNTCLWQTYWKKNFWIFLNFDEFMPCSFFEIFNIYFLIFWHLRIMNHAQNLCVGLIFDALSREPARLAIRDTFTFSRSQVWDSPI